MRRFLSISTALIIVAIVVSSCDNNDNIAPKPKYGWGKTMAGNPQQGMIPMDAKRKIKNEVFPVNYGVSANIGVSYKLAPLHSILLEVGGNYGFRKLQKSVEIGENRIGAATVVVGYAYKLK